MMSPYYQDKCPDYHCQTLFSLPTLHRGTLLITKYIAAFCIGYLVLYMALGCSIFDHSPVFLMCQIDATLILVYIPLSNCQLSVAKPFWLTPLVGGVAQWLERRSGWRSPVVLGSSPDLWLSCDHFVGKVSAIGQPTRPT